MTISRPSLGLPAVAVAAMLAGCAHGTLSPKSIEEQIAKDSNDLPTSQVVVVNCPTKPRLTKGSVFYCDWSVTNLSTGIDSSRLAPVKVKVTVLSDTKARWEVQGGSTGTATAK